MRGVTLVSYLGTSMMNLSRLIAEDRFYLYHLRKFMAAISRSAWDVNIVHLFQGPPSIVIVRNLLVES